MTNKLTSIDVKILELHNAFLISNILSEKEIFYCENIITDRECNNYKITIEARPYRRMITISEIVKKYMLRNKLTINSFAKTLSIGRPALSNFLNKKSSLSFKLADSLSEHLKIRAETLLKIDLEEQYIKFKIKGGK